MKKIIHKITVAFLLLTGTLVYYGCNKSKLDLLPHGPTEQSFFTKEADFTQAVLGVYAKLTDFFWFNGSPGSSPITPFILPGDDITTNNSTEEFEQFGSLQPSSGRISYLFAAHYQLITRANVVLQKIADVQDGIYTTPGLKDMHEGEALFLRGYGFYNLWNFWGTAPLDTARVTTPDQFSQPGTTGTQLLDQAIADFTAAAALLPASWDDANRGRATKNSAYGMLGKSLVFRASANKDAADYTAALNAFNAITGVSLVADFGDNFAWDTENNAESLWEFQASQAFGFDNVWLSNDFDNAVGSLAIYWGFYSDVQTQGLSRYYGTQKLLETFDPADPRLPSTINATDRTVTKYASRDKLNQSGAASINNYRILRYADVLLLKAEALTESGGSTTEAIGLINQVRARARGTGTAPANLSTAESDRNTIMNWIINERLMELAGEGQRWFDLRRWQMQGIINLNNAYFSSNTSNVSFELPKHLNFPIPNSEIDVNPNVPQNTGY